PFLRLLIEQCFVRSDAGLAFGAAGLRRHTNPFELAFERSLPFALRLFFTTETFLLLLQPGRVVAFERNALAAIQLQNPAGHVVDEIPVFPTRVSVSPPPP